MTSIKSCFLDPVDKPRGDQGEVIHATKPHVINAN
ncbi:MAG TPA: palindromic element RPE4 domain-containing protein [Rickettsia endosymbiont of Columbicola hoogstraali]|nr:palindromic element RPE4 domain-containing protein [Rickettsia endosymbiont of Columbicola hoogstraali]